MRRLSLLLLVGFGAFAVAGCGFIDGFLNGGDNASTPDDELVLDGVPLPTNEAEQSEEFTEPIVPVAPGAAAIAAAELIRSTNPDERASRVSTSRSDPFATVVPATPILVELPEAPDDPSDARGDSPGTQGPIAILPSGVNQTPGGVSPIQPLPSLPQPQLAQAVGVSGVVQVGNTTHAIVQAPGEPTSRYVTAGQRLSNGRILVKRIEIREGLEPRVILEENGIEVAVTVGTMTETASAEAANSAVPASQASVNNLPTLPPAPQFVQSQG
ncbi:MAG: hypothetical protein AAF215_21735 [Cyanobacteria bacterium P01_A01_bin.123]